MPETDVLIVFLVTGARLLVPLAIPRYPLPASIAALAFDAGDGAAHAAYAELFQVGYQEYDKALDIYYLAIQYLSTMRNWTNLFAFKVGRFLFYYRLVGGLLFELLQIHALFFIFANTFEYFFLFYEGARLRWNPERLRPALILAAAGAIWVFIKIPQEYWIHIAQLDVYDVKLYGFGVPADTSWGTIVAQNLALFGALAVVAAGLVVALRWFIVHRLPPADWPLSFEADPHGGGITEDDVQAARRAGASRVFDAELLEKVVLISVVTVIFSRMLPGVRGDVLPAAFAVALVVVANTVISEWLIRRGARWHSAVAQFSVVAGTNLVIAAGLALLLPPLGGQLNVVALLFSLLLLTILVTLYDRYRPMYLARVHAARESA